LRGAVDVVEICGDELCGGVRTAALAYEAKLPGLREFKLETVRLRGIRK
jgi:hypothetical protein